MPIVTLLRLGIEAQARGVLGLDHLDAELVGEHRREGRLAVVQLDGAAPTGPGDPDLRGQSGGSVHVDAHRETADLALAQPAEAESGAQVVGIGLPRRPEVTVDRGQAARTDVRNRGRGSVDTEWLVLEESAQGGGAGAGTHRELAVVRRPLLRAGSSGPGRSAPRSRGRVRVRT